MSLGTRLRQLREMAGLSQNELAQRARVHRPMISLVESGKQQDITLETARRLAQVLGVKLELLAGSGEDDDPVPRHRRALAATG